jgi:hypothetical protein
VRIQVIAPPSEEYVDKGNGKGYNKLTLTFKNFKPDGKAPVEAKSIMDFANKEVYDRLKAAKTNDMFQIKLEKVNGYWNWTEVHRDDGEAPVEVAKAPAQATTGVKVNTYEDKNKLDRERFEFDKEKQKLIIRQSCLASAVDLCKDHGKQPDPAQVIGIAAEFENYVWGRGVAGITNDIPE